MLLRYDAGAEAYDRLTGRWTALFAADVLRAANIPCDGMVLDLATGTGDTALLAAAAQPPSTVVGVDLSVPMLRVAKRKCGHQAAVLFLAGNAQALPFANRAFKAIVCQFGLMFFPERRGALAGLRGLLCRGGSVVFSVWNTWDRAPFAGIVAQALCREMPAEREELLRPFSLADPQALCDLLAGAGFENVDIRLAVREARYANFDDYWEPVEAGGGRLGQAYLALPAAAQVRVRQTVKDNLGQYTCGSEIAMSIEAYIAQARA